METAYFVERDIEPVEFSEQYVENRRKDIRKELIDEGITNPSDELVERRVREELEEVAQDMTLNAQGDNSLHRDIDVGSAVKNE